jgi:AcrR family transcriptional regulator
MERKLSRVLGLRERGKIERRGRIQRAARAVFREKGFDAATTREIAERAEVGVGTLFGYARDKSELLMMIVNDELDAMADQTFSTVPRGAPLIDQLLHVFEPHYRFWAADPEFSRRALFEAYGSLTRPPNERVESVRFHERRERTLHELTRVIREKQLRKRISSDVDPALVAHLVFDIYIGENRKWISSPYPRAKAGVARLREVLTVALRGVAPAPAEVAAPRSPRSAKRN